MDNIDKDFEKVFGGKDTIIFEMGQPGKGEEFYLNIYKNVEGEPEKTETLYEFKTMAPGIFERKVIKQYTNFREQYKDCNFKGIAIDKSYNKERDLFELNLYDLINLIN